MNQEELNALFNKQASTYETQHTKLAPIHGGLYFQLEWIFSELPRSAHILCVGLGIGAELSYLANRFPNWRFTAVEPSGAMLDVCRQKAQNEGYAGRCSFHEGYVETLPEAELHPSVGETRSSRVGRVRPCRHEVPSLFAPCEGRSTRCTCVWPWGPKSHPSVRWPQRSVARWSCQESVL